MKKLFVLCLILLGAAGLVASEFTMSLLPHIGNQAEPQKGKVVQKYHVLPDTKNFSWIIRVDGVPLPIVDKCENPERWILVLRMEGSNQEIFVPVSQDVYEKTKIGDWHELKEERR